jgi:hypothetical protein
MLTPRNDEAVDDDRLPVTERGPLTNQEAHDCAHLEDFPSHEGAFLIPVYLLMHDGLSLKHADPQGSDLSADFVDAIVHGCSPCWTSSIRTKHEQ